MNSKLLRYRKMKINGDPLLNMYRFLLLFDQFEIVPSYYIEFDSKTFRINKIKNWLG